MRDVPKSLDAICRKAISTASKDRYDSARAFLLRAIAKTYQGLGLYQLAVKTHTEAYSIRTATLGAKHPETLASATDLGEAHAYAGQPELAVPLYEMAVAEYRKTRPSGDSELLAAMAGRWRPHTSPRH